MGGLGATQSLRDGLRTDCAAGDLTVSIGFEAPPFVALRDAPARLSSVRGPWDHSSFAGASVLVTGLVELARVLRDVGREVTTDAERCSPGQLLVWEAFIFGTGTVKLLRPACPGGTHDEHACDALAGAANANLWLRGIAPREAAIRRTSDWALGDDERGLDLVRAALGQPSIVTDTAQWGATVVQLAKPVHRDLSSIQRSSSERRDTTGE